MARTCSGKATLPIWRAFRWGGVAALLLTLSWSGCFYGVADLEVVAAPSNGGSAAAPSAGSAGLVDAAGASGSVPGAGGDGAAGQQPQGGSGGTLPDECPEADPDCEFRKRCSDSALVPRVFASGQLGPYALIADKTQIFWSDRNANVPAEGTIRVRGVAGGSKVVVAATAQISPGVLALDEAFVYWTSEDRILRVARGSGAAGAAPDVPELLASDQRTPSGLAVDDSFVYWVTRSGTSLFRLEKGLPRTAAVALGATKTRAQQLTQDATTLFWTTSTGYVESVVKQGGVSAVLVTPEQLTTLFGAEVGSNYEADGIALDDAWVYFRARGLRVAPAKADTGKLLRVRKDGSGLELLVDNRVGGISFLAIATGQLYFTTGSSGGEVWRSESDGSGLVLLSCQAEAYPRGIAISGNRVYWGNFLGATVVWAPK